MRIESHWPLRMSLKPLFDLFLRRKSFQELNSIKSIQSCRGFVPLIFIAMAVIPLTSTPKRLAFADDDSGMPS